MQKEKYYPSHGKRISKRRRIQDFLSSIPEDLLFEILIRLPVVNLLRLRLVCKSWHEMISGPHFVSIHHDRAKKADSLKVALIPRQQNGEEELLLFSNEVGSRTATLALRMQLPSANYHLVRASHSNGLLLIPTVDVGFIVCNPSTRELITLPKGRNNFFGQTPEDGISDGFHLLLRASFGFDPCAKEYKAVRFFYRYPHTTTSSVGFEVFTIGRDSSWRAMDDPPYPTNDSTPASVDGTIFWKVAQHKHIFPPAAILRFDLNTEKFGVVAPPCKSLYTRYDNVVLAQVQNVLSLVDKHPRYSKVDVWMYSCTENSWALGFSIDLLVIPADLRPLAVEKDGKLLLYMGMKLCRYNSRSKSVERVVNTMGNMTYRSPKGEICPGLIQPMDFHVIPYTESLVKLGKGTPNTVLTLPTYAYSASDDVAVGYPTYTWRKWVFRDSFWTQFRSMLHHRR